jgi:hypothetical protein
MAGRAEGTVGWMREVMQARGVVSALGGCYSAKPGIDVDAGDAEIERWFLAATLFGTRIAARIAERAFRELADTGLTRISQVRHVPTADPIGLLDALPGWGEVTVRLFLREVRGVWPGAQPPLDERAAAASRHLDLLPSGAVLADLARLADMAGAGPARPGKRPCPAGPRPRPGDDVLPGRPELRGPPGITMSGRGLPWASHAGLPSCTRSR